MTEKREIKGELIFASVAEGSSGIHVRVATHDDDGKDDFKVVFFSVNKKTGDMDLRLREGMDAEVELQKVCDLLNENIEITDDKTGHVVGLKKRTITLIEG